MDRTSHQKERYRDLLRELIEEEGGLAAHGARSRAARRLGINQSYVSKLLSGERSVGLDSLDTAVDRLRIRREYFMGPDGESYKAYLVSKPAPERTEAAYAYPALAEFLATPLGSTVDDDLREQMAGIRFKHEPTVETYRLLMATLQTTLPANVAAAEAETTAEALRRGKARGFRMLPPKGEK